MDHKPNVVASAVGLLIFATAVAWGSYALLHRPQRAETPGAIDETPEAAQARAVGAARVAVLATLRDPGSAQFSGVQAGKGASGAAVCGLVNALRGTEVRAGAQRFISTPGKLVIDGNNTPAEVDSAWRETCL